MEKLKLYIKKYSNMIYPLLTLAAVMLLWLVIARAVGVELIVPQPASALKDFFRLLSEGSFYKAVGTTLLRTVISFLLSFVAAAVLAIFSARIPTVDKIFSPVVTIIRAVPTLSVILIALIWFSSKITPVFIAFLMVFPILYSGFHSAISGVDKNLLDMAKAYKVNNSTVIKDLYVPLVLPGALDSVKSALSMNIKLIISAEILAGTRHSIGDMMQTSKIYLETSKLMAWTIAAILLSYLLELAVRGLKKLLVRW